MDVAVRRMWDDAAWYVAERDHVIAELGESVDPAGIRGLTLPSVRVLCTWTVQSKLGICGNQRLYWQVQLLSARH